MYLPCRLTIPFALACTVCAPVTAQTSESGKQPVPAPTWESSPPAESNSGTTWQAAPPAQPQSPSNWQPDPTTNQPIAAPKASDQPETDQKPSFQTPLYPWILGLGGGARIGLGEPTYGMVYGRVGRAIGTETAISLRPAYVFGNVNGSGASTNQGAFQMPLTIDLFPTSRFSPYAGAGIATNTDSNGNTDAMITAGLDVNLAKHVSLSLGFNYIIETSDSDNKDVEAFTVLYFRF